MEYFYIITNPTKDIDLKTAYFIRDYLLSKGKQCVIDAGEAKGTLEGYTDKNNVPAEVDCVIVLGGDGTMLQAAVDLSDRDIPFLGINLGTLGFLAEVNVSDIENALDRLIAEEYQIENRMMIYGLSYQNEKLKDSARALNDIVITRKGSLQIIYFNIYVNGQFLHRYHADGIIVATPTGSTGYNLSAGGPIIDPKASMILITPVCPHSMHNRSIVLSPEDEITVEIESGREGNVQEVEAIFDGSHKVPLSTGERIEIRKSDKTTGIVKLSQVSFLEILHRKMKD